jgi:hypothetical protein
VELKRNEKGNSEKFLLTSGLSLMLTTATNASAAGWYLLHPSPGENHPLSQWEGLGSDDTASECNDHALRLTASVLEKRKHCTEDNDGCDFAQKELYVVLHELSVASDDPRLIQGGNPR